MLYQSDLMICMNFLNRHSTFTLSEEAAEEFLRIDASIYSMMDKAEKNLWHYSLELYLGPLLIKELMPRSYISR